MKPNQTEQKIISVALDLVQSRGFGGFSFRDLSQEVGIKTSSIHYYFKTKEDLILVLINNYRLLFRLELKNISSKNGNALSKLNNYVKIFEGALKNNNKHCREFIQ